jgi:phosphohistidine phosphatase
MSKRLILMRHAKAEKLEGYSSDFDRPITKRGIYDAKLICSELNKHKFIPDAIVASPSKRTKQTAQIVSNCFKKNKIPIDYQFDIYEASISDLLHVIRQTNTNINTLMLIGHNPSITSMVGYLTGSFVEHVSTSGIVIIQLNSVNWQTVLAHKGELIYVLNPKSLKA